MDKIVYISGCWDLFHVGHLRVLKAAEALGDFLIVGVCTDDFALSYKRRPVIPYEQRAEIVSALGFVDMVLARDSVDDIECAKKWKVNVRAIGPQYGSQMAGQQEFLEWARNNGVDVVTIPRTPDISTTIIREVIREGKTVSDNVCGRSGGDCGGSVVE